MKRETPKWAGDTSPSLPDPPKRPKVVAFGGFVWTDGGMAHDIDETDVARMSIPPFAPPSMRRT